MPIKKNQSERIVSKSGEGKEYDIALSFAGEDHSYVEALANALSARNIKLFCSRHKKALLLGKELRSYFSNLFQFNARFCVIFISANYVQKEWTNHELEAALKRAFTENKEYILPIRLDDTEIPGLPPTIGYFDWFKDGGAEEFAKIIVDKLRPQNYNVIYFKNNFLRYYRNYFGRDKDCKSLHYVYMALALTVRDDLMEKWTYTYNAYKEQDCKRAYYLSMEFLMGRTLSNAMLNLGVNDTVSQAMYDFGLDLEELIEAEPDAGLGNGSLGRLAACFIDSCATLHLPVTGYGLRYEYGMFTQTIVNGEQVEEPDHWLRNGNVWEIDRLEYQQRIKFGGRTERHIDENGHIRVCWVYTQDVLAVPFDTPIPGYQNGTVNTLRLWKATATEQFDLQEFNAGDYAESVAAKNTAANITMVLYPNDANENGKALRMQQQYLLASASLQDVLEL